LTRVAPANLALAAGPLGHEPGAQQSLEVQHELELLFAHLAHQADEPPRPGMAPEHINLVHGGTRAYQRRKYIPHNPRQAPLRTLGLDRRRHLQSVHDVTERGRLDDKHLWHGGESDRVVGAAFPKFASALTNANPNRHVTRI